MLAKGTETSHMVGRAMMGEAMERQGYLREKQAETIEWAPYTPGNCVICGVLCVIVRWRGQNHEKPAHLPDGSSMHYPQDHIVWRKERGTSFNL